jgi:hypothetical protein
MIPSRALALYSVFAVAGLAACQPKTVPANPPPPQVSAPPVAAPAKMVTMVCRNSQTGAAAECGTPNAVMVGVKEK